MNAQEIRAEVERRCNEALPTLRFEWIDMLNELKTLTDEDIPMFIATHGKRLPHVHLSLKRVIEEILTLLDPQGGRCQGCNLWVPKTTLQVVASESYYLDDDLDVCDTCVGEVGP